MSHDAYGALHQALWRTDDTALPTEPVAGAVKHEAGKAPVGRGCLSYFGRALQAVANVSAFGYSKYKGWGGWRKVEDAESRYRDALARHLLEVGDDLRGVDPETGLYHLAAVAWNALALLEMVVEKDCGQRAFTPYVEKL